MKITILIPHFKQGRITAVCVSQLLKLKGRHEIDILVIDNNVGDGSARYLDPFLEHITILDYPMDKLQSHGIAFDFAIPHIKTEYFLTVESDSYPTMISWLDYYEFLIDQGYDTAGSFLELSGGLYQHPCGSFYRKSVWEECKKFVEAIPYTYFPNAAHKEGFDCHAMIHDKLVDEFVKHPSKFVEPSEGYKNLTPLQVTEKGEYYSPIGEGVFHNGMGALEESIKTYGNRDIDTGIKDMDFSKAADIVRRIGNEPGQFLSYWHLAAGKKVYGINTQVKWLPGREYQNQEFTKMENGFVHLWGISSYHKAKLSEAQWVVMFKAEQAEKLYNSLPEEQKIPAIADGGVD